MLFCIYLNFTEKATTSQKPKRRPYLLKKKALSTGFFDSGTKRDDGKGKMFGFLNIYDLHAVSDWGSVVNFLCIGHIP